MTCGPLLGGPSALSRVQEVPKGPGILIFLPLGLRRLGGENEADFLLYSQH